jgi:DNA-binding Xre family transcriptional regulator
MKADAGDSLTRVGRAIVTAGPVQPVGQIFGHHVDAGENQSELVLIHRGKLLSMCASINPSQDVVGVILRVPRRRIDRLSAPFATRLRTPQHSKVVTLRWRKRPAMILGMPDRFANVLVGMLLGHHRDYTQFEPGRVILLPRGRVTPSARSVVIYEHGLAIHPLERQSGRERRQRLTMAKKKQSTHRKLSAAPTRVRRKFSASERAQHTRIQEQVEAEILPKPVSAARVALAKLRNLRRQADVSLAELSRRTGITKSNLSRLENSGDNAKVQTLERYAEALGVTLVIDVKKQAG